MTAHHKVTSRLPQFVQPFARRLPIWCIEVFLFVAVGGAQLVVDAATFIGLSHWGLSVPIANVVARMAGALLGFWLNGKITFLKEDERLHRVHLGRFAMFWLAATAVSTGALALATHTLGLVTAWIIKPVIEILLAIVSFLVSRHWIYR
ncbi:putative flippase GtrA [Luteibacter sp. W1I16]|uniref:GtrA family protein n=1 Tax=Luteibacter sp. W1I16 TaxID=3373922 RepID=UPI003D23A677